MAADEDSASERARELSFHIAHSPDPKDDVVRSLTRRRRKQTTAPAGPPADYSDRIGQIKALEKLACTPDINHRGYVRQKKAGKLWFGSEIGSVAGDVKWGKEKSEQGTEEEVIIAFTPSNSVQGYGRLNGRKVVFTADDYTLRAGHADGALMEKTLYIEKLALSLRLPIVKLVDGSSGGGSVTSIRQSGFSYIPPLPAFDQVIAQLNLGIPNLGAVLGPAIGLGAARVTAYHFSVMAANVGSLFNAGPHMVKGVTFEDGLTMAELGGPDMHCRNGTIDNMARDEYDAFEQIRCVLSCLPNSGFSAPPVIKSGDTPDRREDALRNLIPRRKERMYDPRRLITLVVDNSSFFEIGALWGTTAIVGLGRLAGSPIGIVSNNCESHTGGALDALGSQKITKHPKLCDAMNLPILQFVDVPSYAVGTAAERSATMRHGVNLAMAYCTTTMLVFSVKQADRAA
ncbi:hypothetical protein RRF57_001177 [Xylaria bambusicola]|uniref:CoA carboxyltransferase C-terminal domain-containing protein n=1 Tax=Xylaria bambusicola TaxID=326684 RepID=A0AAN7Z603_9PEZI